MKRIYFFIALLFTLICFVSCVNINDLISGKISSENETLTLDEFLAEETQNINATATISNNADNEVTLEIYYIYDNEDCELAQTITLASGESKNVEITKNKIKLSAKYVDSSDFSTEDISLIKLKGNFTISINDVLNIGGDCYVVARKIIRK